MLVNPALSSLSLHTITIVTPIYLAARPYALTPSVISHLQSQVYFNTTNLFQDIVLWYKSQVFS